MAERDVSRRSVVRTAAALACAPAAIALGGCARRISVARDVQAACPVDGVLTVPLALAPELRSNGGSVVVHPPPGAGNFAPVLVANAGSGFVALDAICPHQGCELSWVPEDREAECPCHGSRFASDGTLLAPPAQSDVTRRTAALAATGDAVLVRLFEGDGALPAVVNGAVTFAVAAYPELQQVGGVRIGHPDGSPVPLLIRRAAATGGSGDFVVLSAACTHLGCTVFARRDPTSGLPASLLCPCHGSQFRLDGSVLPAQPAQVALPVYAVTFDGTTVSIAIPTVQCP